MKRAIGCPFLVILALWAISLYSWSAAFAIELRAGQKVTIAADEVIADDLYVTGEVVTIDGVVEGDVVATGREIILNGGVLGDLIAAGQGIVINGQIGDDARIAGMALQFADGSAVGDDVIAAGFSLEATEDSLVAGSVVFSGFQALLAGTVGERLLGQMAALRIDGKIGEGGEVKVDGEGPAPPFFQFIPTPVQIPEVPGGLSVGSRAEISGELLYTSPQVAESQGEIENLVHIEVESSEPEPGFGDRLVRVGARWAAILVVALILLLVVPAWLGRRASQLSERPLASFGWGLAGVVGLPVLVALLLACLLLLAVLLGLLSLDVLVAVVVLGGVLAVLGLAFAIWLGLGLVGQSVVALSLGRSLSARMGASWGEAGRGIVALVVGGIVLAALSVIPFVGGIAAFLVALLGFGALVAWVVRPLFGAAR